VGLELEDFALNFVSNQFFVVYVDVGSMFDAVA